VTNEPTPAMPHAAFRRPIHPDLRSDTWMNQWLGMPLMALFGAGVLIGSGWATVAGKMPWPIFILCIAASGGFAWAAMYGWRSRDRSERMTWVLEELSPQRVRLSIGLLDTGAPVIQMVPVRSATVQWSMTFAPPSWNVMELDGTEVNAHIDPVPGGPIVLETPRGILWPLDGSKSKHRSTTST
jgi:hypothetical protein